MSESYVEVREDGAVRLAGTLAYPQATVDDVLTVQADGSIAAAAGGAGAVARGPFAFAFDTPNLAAGVPVGYTPAVGDLILSAWVEVDTAFTGGTTPSCDFSCGATNDGWLVLSFTGVPWDLTQAAQPYGSQIQPLVSSGYPVLIGARITGADPLELWVTQTGTKGDAASGATAGAARLYIVTASPLAFA